MSYNNITFRMLIICLFLIAGLGWPAAGDDTKMQSDSILTYAAAGGTGMMSHEKISLIVAGNYSDSGLAGRPVFGRNPHSVLPAFQSKVSAESTLLGVQSMAVQSSSSATDTASEAFVPAEVHYSIHIDPLSGLDSYAQGVVSVVFKGEIQEAAGSTGFDGIYYTGDDITGQNTNPWNRNYWDDPARITSYIDRITVAGGITDLSKTFDYISQVSL